MHNIMLKNLLAFILLLGSLGAPLGAQTPGDLAVVGFNSDGNDDLALVALATIPANTTIYFRDDEWNGTAFADAAESSYGWNTGSAPIAAGTVIIFTNVTNGPTSNVGTVTRIGTANTGISNSGEGIFFYLGTDVNTPTTFLFAVANGAATTSFGSLEGTGLALGTTALLLTNGTDIGAYKGVRSGLDKAGYLAAFNLMSNWDLQDASGDQSIDGTAPDLPFNANPFILGAGGDVTPPSVTSVQVTSATTLTVTFSEEVTAASATTIQNYTINPAVAITGISYDNAAKRSTLTVAPLESGTRYRLSINGIQDLVTPPNTQTVAFSADQLYWNSYAGTDLVISEINYNPYNQNSVNTDSLEFVEVYNRSTAAIRIGGLRFTAGIIGTFAEQTVAAGATVQIAFDSLRARRFYGVPFQKWTSDNLSNGGEALVIKNSAGAVLDSVSYDDATPWPVTADGTGFSLELIDARQDNNVATNWRASTTNTNKTVAGAPIFASPGRYALPAVATLNFAAASVSVSENAGQVAVNFQLNGTGSAAATVELVVSSGSATAGSDYTFATQTLNIAAGATVVPAVNIPIINDNATEADEYFVLRFRNANGVNLAPNAAQVVFIRDNETTAPRATDSLQLQLVASYKNPTAGSSEIVAYERNSRRLYIANSVAGRIDIVNFSNPAAPRALRSINTTALGGLNSVAVNNNIIAAAFENSNPVLPGQVVFFDTAGTILKQVTAGVLPDHVSFTPDGRFVLTANEGQPAEDYAIDPEGSVSIIDISGGIAALTQANVTTLNFQSLNPLRVPLVAAGLRVFGRKGGAVGGSSVAEDLEPEYIAYSADSRFAYVTCQENNAAIVIDIANKSIAIINGLPGIRPLGFKNHNLLGNGLDASDQSNGNNLTTLPVFGTYMPDAVASFNANGRTYLITANEGDAREYAAYIEETNIGSIKLNPASFPDSADLRLNALVGRLKLTSASGDTDGDGDYDQLVAFGSRSFTIWDDQGSLVWDSGDALERIIRDNPTFGPLFNANNGTNPAPKNRSDDKGPEPEGVTTAVLSGKTYAFVCLERVGGVMVYDVSNPAAPVFVTYANNRALPASANDDRGAEGIIFIPANESPNGQNLVILANEVSNSLSIFQVTDRTRRATSVNEPGRLATSFQVFPNPVSEQLQFSRPLSGWIYNALGQPVERFVAVDRLLVRDWTPGWYLLQADNGEVAKFMVK